MFFIPQSSAEKLTSTTAGSKVTFRLHDRGFSLPHCRAGANIRGLMVKTAGLQVLLEDDDVLVVDKPGDLVCHSASRPEHTSLAELVRAHGIGTPRMVNRLDRETSGIVIVAKNERAARLLGKQVLRREIEKEYTAICVGRFEPARGTVDQPIGVTPDGLVFTRRVIAATGKPSVTDFEVERQLTNFTIVRLWPRTGRAHQLRVHLAWLGHPLVGDKIYGPDERLYLEFIEKGLTREMLGQLLLPRHALHAGAVTFRHPQTQQPVTVRAELPADMAAFIEEQG